MPTGSRPWWRATPGSRDRTTEAVMPTPTRETRSSSTLRRNVPDPGRTLAAPMTPTTNLRRVRLGLRGQLSGWAATEIALAVDPRLAPSGGWVPRPPKRFGRKRYYHEGPAPDRPIVPFGSWVECRIRAGAAAEPAVLTLSTPRTEAGASGPVAHWVRTLPRRARLHRVPACRTLTGRSVRRRRRAGAVQARALDGSVVLGQDDRRVRADTHRDAVVHAVRGLVVGVGVQRVAPSRSPRRSRPSRS